MTVHCPTVNTRRREVLALVGAGLSGVSSLNATAQVQAWPSRSVRFVVPFPAGSSPDVTARIIAARLGDSLGQTVVIENRTGAAGIIGADIVAKAQPDGYTLLYPVNSVICANPHLYSKLPYDGLRSFVPVTMTVRFGYVLLARNDFPANDIPGLIATAKSNPGKYNFGSAGIGAGNHIVMEMFLDMTGTKMVHVPHRDSALSVATGESDLSMVPATTAVPLVASGKVKPLGVSLPGRLAALPGVSAIADTVPGYSGDAWHGVLAPAGTPPEIVDKLAGEIAKILAMPEVAKRLTDIGLTPVANSPADFAAAVKADFDRWGAAIRKANIRLD